MQWVGFHVGVGPLSILLSVLTSVFTPPTLTKKKYKAPLKAVFGHLHDQQCCSSGFIKCQHHPGQVKEQRPTENNITGFGGGGMLSRKRHRMRSGATGSCPISQRAAWSQAFCWPHTSTRCLRGWVTSPHHRQSLRARLAKAAPVTDRLPVHRTL